MRLRVESCKAVMVVTKPQDPCLIPLTRELVIWIFENFHINVYVGHELKSNKEFDYEGIGHHHRLKFWTPEWVQNNAEDVGLVITLGGDGTVLFTGEPKLIGTPVVFK